MTFIDMAAPFVTAIIATGGEMPQLAWVNHTISTTLSVSQISQLLAREDVGDAILDVPRPLIPE